MPTYQNSAVVTGGAGFVGSFLCERLIADGYRVACIDNLLTGSKENITHLQNKDGFSFRKQDVRNLESFDIDPDLIFNLASPASPVHYREHPLKTFFTNTVGMRNVLGLAQEYDAKVVQASTSEVYGDPTEHPQSENYNGNVDPLTERGCYEEGKRGAETLCADYRRMHDVPVTIMRIFNTYGPRMAADDGRVVSNFILRALEGDDLKVHGDGMQTRSFQYVSDLIDGIIKAAEANDFFGPVNIGNTKEITINELAETIIGLVDTSSAIEHTESREADPQRRRPDITRAKQKLDWRLTVSLQAGLKKTIDYFRDDIRTNV